MLCHYQLTTSGTLMICLKRHGNISISLECEWKLNWNIFYHSLSWFVKIRPVYEPSGPSGWHLSLVSVLWNDQEYFYSPLDGMLVHHRVTRNSKFADTHLYTSVERDTVCSKTQTRLVPETLDLEASILTMRPPNIAILSNWSQIWFCT